MSYIIEGDVVVSFADFQDCVDRDQRLFESNEGISDDTVEQHLIRTTEKILSRFRASSWWKSYYVRMNSSQGGASLTVVPPLDPNYIRARLNDFTDLCVYQALSDYILPSIADFGREDNSERQKMGYYAQRAEQVYAELLTAGDWYDFNEDGTVQDDEVQAGVYNLKRVR